MPDDFVIARNPEPGSALPFLIRLPLGQGVVLKARETWPRTAKVYCHRALEWPEDPEVLERVPVRSCVRRGAAIDLVLDRGRENRSQLVFTRIRGGREAIFWQSSRTAKQARPNVSLPTARAQGLECLTVLVDVRERYAYQFAQQQVVTERRALPAGDYAVELDGRVVAAVERKSLQDLASSLLNGKLRFALAELSALPRAAVVVEDRYSQIFSLERVRPAVVADALAEAQVRFPGVPIVFTETRPLAQEWTYRFLGAALAELGTEQATVDLESTLTPAAPLPAPSPSPAEVRAWAQAHGVPVSDRGRLSASVVEAYLAAQTP
ncbi:MAG: histone-like nucleoid-structuring protein Lsr2 [Actinomycetes bacterium]